MCDLLLVNVTNLPWRGVFPYAFVQVSEVAARFGRTVVRCDLRDVPRARWGERLRALVQAHRPRMVGFHVRQTDTLIASNYLAAAKEWDQFHNYFPLHDVRGAIALVREITDAPIVVGGFGFSSDPARILPFLGADYGVRGSPDHVFERFDDLLAGRARDDVANLARAPGGVYVEGPRVFHPPSPRAEWEPALVDEFLRFHGQQAPDDPSGRAAPIELSRGCPFRCYFCAEPEVKGTRVAYRPIDAVMEDVARLYRRGVSDYWMVCSELNHARMDPVHELVERLVRFREANPGGPPVRWWAYYLPMMPMETLRLLRASGFVRAWNDVVSLDDENLRRARVPYRARSVVQNLENVLALREEEGDAEPLRLDLFLGNAFATPESVARTVQLFEAHGLKGSFDAAEIISATRVRAGAPTERLYTIGPRGPTASPDFVLPTFQYPPALMQRLGSRQEVEGFLDWAANTFLSNGYMHRYEWCAFLARASTPEAFFRIAEEVPFDDGVELGALADDDEVTALLAELARPLTRASVRRLFGFRAGGARLHAHVTEVILFHVLRHHAPRTRRVLELLGIEHDEHGAVQMTEYQLVRALAPRWHDEESLVSHVMARLGVDRGSVEVLKARHLLHDANVVLRPEWTSLLFGAAREPLAPARRLAFEGEGPPP